MTLVDQLVTLVVRTAGGRRPEIKRALASAYNNAYRPVDVVVVYQGNDADEIDFLQSLAIVEDGWSIRIVQNSASGDRRAENLNIGWTQGRGRYLGFLDDDDTLTEGHFLNLIKSLESSGHAWAYGQTVLRREDENLVGLGDTYPFLRSQFSVVDLWHENFIPIHSFLIDRQRLVSELAERPFYEALERSEDWDFLIRLAFFHEPAVLSKTTCVYHVSVNSRNTNVSLMSDMERKRQVENERIWARCKTLVEARKRELLARVWWAKPVFGDFWSSGLPAVQHVAVADNDCPVSDSNDNPLMVDGQGGERRLTRRRIVRALIRRLERFL